MTDVVASFRRLTMPIADCADSHCNPLESPYTVDAGRVQLEMDFIVCTRDKQRSANNRSDFPQVLLEVMRSGAPFVDRLITVTR